MITHAKFHFNRFMLTLIFGTRTSNPRASRTTEKAGPDDRVNPSGLRDEKFLQRFEVLVKASYKEVFNKKMRICHCMIFGFPADSNISYLFYSLLLYLSIRS